MVESKTESKDTPNTNSQIDDFDLFDSALNLEQSAYEDGYKEGVEAGRIAGIQEGSEYGLQTGFQRYLAIGVLHGRCKVWRYQITDYQDRIEKQKQLLASGDPSLASSTNAQITEASKKLEKAEKALSGLESLIKRENLPMTNDDADVAKFEQIIRKAKSKAKIIHSSMKITIGDGLDVEVEDPPISYLDEKIQKMLKPVEDVLEDFRI